MTCGQQRNDIHISVDLFLLLEDFTLNRCFSGFHEMEARMKLAASILEYAEDYYNDFSYWSSAPNRKSHIPYVFKALFIGDIQKIGDSIQCQAGKI